MGEIVYRIFCNAYVGIWYLLDCEGHLLCRCWTVQEAIACLPPEHRS